MEREGLDRHMVRAVIQRMEEIGLSFDWYGPDGDTGNFGSTTLSKQIVLEGIFSSAKHPLETIMLGITDDEYEKWLTWFHGPEDKFKPQRCLAKTKKGKQCSGHAQYYCIPVKNFEKHAFCRVHLES